MSSTATSSATPLEFDIGSTLFYVVIGAGGIMTILLIIILILCVAIGCLVARKRQTYTVQAAAAVPANVRPLPASGGQNHNEEGRTLNQQLQQSQQQGISYNTYTHANALYCYTHPVSLYFLSPIFSDRFRGHTTAKHVRYSKCRIRHDTRKR